MIDFRKIGKLSIISVDGTNPANQLRLVGFPISHRVLYILDGAGFLPSAVSTAIFEASSFFKTPGHGEDGRFRRRKPNRSQNFQGEERVKPSATGKRGRRCCFYVVLLEGAEKHTTWKVDDSDSTLTCIGCIIFAP